MGSTPPPDPGRFTVLPGRADPDTPAATTTTAAAPGSTSRARTDPTDGPHSALEFLLEHLAAPPPTARRTTATTATTWRDDHGHRHRRKHVRATPGILADPEHWPHRSKPPRPHNDLPPF